MTIFRPCIDLHQGCVKQIVGGTLSDEQQDSLTINFVSEHEPAWFADKYKSDNAVGGHIIKLGPGNDEAALNALRAWPQGMHLGGGINIDNAESWLTAGAEKVIVTSFLFDNDEFQINKLIQLEKLIGKQHIVVDLSCRKKDDTWFVATNRWQTITQFEITHANLSAVANHCSELLVHAADVEGKCQGIDGDLVSLLGKHCSIPCTYAGGAHAIEDLQKVSDLSNGRVDLTFGSALDIFGGTSVQYADCISWNKQQ